MEKKTWLWIVVAVLYTIILALIFFSWGTYYGMRIGEQTPSPLSQTATEDNPIMQVSPPPIIEEQLEKFTIIEEDEQIVVYQNDQIIKRMNIDLNLLPTENRRLLKEGIVVQGKQELAELLEDYAF